MIKKALNKFSREITQSKSHGAAQAMLYALGFSESDLNKPQIGIASMGYAGNPCNAKLNHLSQIIADNLSESKHVPLPFNTIGISDGISMGTPGMRYSLPSREIIADSIESVVKAHHYDGVVCVPGCDKNLPGSLMALLRLNRPGMIIYGGTMTLSKAGLDIVSAFEAYGKFLSGAITDEERIATIKNACDKGCGACAGLYTANTMAVCLEVLGITLPNSSSNHTASKDKINECNKVGKVMHNLLQKDLKPLDILSRESFLNAIKIMYAFGGSSNAVIHLLACAREAKIELTLDDFQSLSSTPIIMNMRPHGHYVMASLLNLGGTSTVIKYLIQNDILNGDCLTITGKTLWDNVKSAPNFPEGQDVIRSLEAPFKTESHMRILRGNLGGEGSLAKIYKEGSKFSGEALVFESESEFLTALHSNEVRKHHFIVIRNQGESIGCPEMLTPTSALIGYFGDNAPPLATDGRFSGGSHGILVAHLPDAYKKTGLTHLIQNGDGIEIDLQKLELNLQVSDDELIHRKLIAPDHVSDAEGYVKKFAKLCGTFSNGYNTN